MYVCVGGGFGQAVPDAPLLLHRWLQDLPDHSHRVGLAVHTGIESLTFRNVVNVCVCGQAVPDAPLLLHRWLQDLPDHSHRVGLAVHTGIELLAFRNVHRFC